MTRRLTLPTIALLLATAATAQPSAPDGPAVPPAPTASTPDAPFDAARVIERTVLALRIRTLIETWPVYRTVPTASTPNGAAIATEERPIAASFETRLDTALKAIGKGSDADTFRVRELARFALAPATYKANENLPTQDSLRAALTLFERYYPLTTAPAPSASPGVGTVRALGDVAYTVFAPVGSTLATEPAAGGAGVSFQQALIEGTTAFLLDRARADLARAGLDRFQQQLRDSPLRDAFPRSFALGGFYGEGADAYRDPRLYLAALQASLADDFNGLPTFVSSAFQGSDALGLQAHEWTLVHRTLGLVADVQQGTHPLLALSTFASHSAAELAGNDPALRSRLLEMAALTTALYEGSGTADGRSYAARRVLETLDGRRLFAVFLTDELERAEALPPGCGGTVDGCLGAVEDRVATLRQTLDEIVGEVATLRQTFAQIRAASPDQAGAVYADYLAVVTRAVRQVLVTTQGDPPEHALRVLDTAERVLSIREAVVRRDYPSAVAQAMPFLTLLAGEVGGHDLREAVRSLDGALVLAFEPDDASPQRQARALAEAQRLVAAARPSVERAHVLAGNRYNSFVRPDTGLASSELVFAVQALRTVAGEARDAWGRVLGQVPRDVTFDSLKQAHGHVRELGEFVRAALGYERALLSQSRTTLALAVTEAASEEKLQSLVDSLREQLGETDAGQMLVVAATLAATTSSEDVYSALVVYSAPPGSFRDRRRPRRTAFSDQDSTARFAVATYPGVVAGGERVGQWSPHAGLSIPVGIEVTWPKQYGSLGIFVSPLNLGTYADFRLSGGDVDEEPAVTLAQLFSPSAYLTLGFTDDLPITLGIGGSYVPALRDVEGGGGALSAARLSAFLAVDVPLWIFR